jgi:hypothetical protein
MCFKFLPKCNFGLLLPWTPFECRSVMPPPPALNGGKGGGVLGSVRRKPLQGDGDAVASGRQRL